MDYTLLEIARILGKSKSTIEYQVRKLTDHQKAAFLFVDTAGVKHINSAGYEYFKALYAIPEELQEIQKKDQSAEALLRAVEALTAQLAVKDEQIRTLTAQLASATAQAGKLTDLLQAEREAQREEPPKKLAWYRRR